MLLLGLCAMMSDHYRISSNRESGEGRFDIQLMPIGPTPKEMPGIIIELKSDKNDKGQSLETLATQALAQIDARHYDTEMKKAHINKILKYGVAFGGKKVYVVMREET